MPSHSYADFNSLSRDQARRLLETARNSGHYVLLYLALATGMRQGEILGLRWEAVNLEQAFVSVCATLSRDAEGNLALRSLKGKKQGRRVELSPTLVTLLRKHRRRQYPLSPWVFSDGNGKPMRKDNFMHRVFRPMIRKANLGHVRFHDLRHTSATLGLAAGENIKIVQERLGHASAKMTLDVYTKAIPTLQKEAATRMDAILSRDGATFGATRER